MRPPITRRLHMSLVSMMSSDNHFIGLNLVLWFIFHLGYTTNEENKTSMRIEHGSTCL